MNPAGSFTRFGRSELGWLAVAVLVHGLLLLLPLKRFTEVPPRPATLAVTLVTPVRQTPAPTAGYDQVQSVRTQAASADAAAPRIPPDDAPAITPPPQANDLDEMQPGTAPAQAPITTASLVISAGETSLQSEAAPSARALGRDVSRAAPANWQRGAGAGLLTGSGDADQAAHARQAIVDRWLAADGSHHVQVAMPDGTLVCGRVNAWDPLRPLVEHVMQFHTCGRRVTFSMPARETLARSYPGADP